MAEKAVTYGIKTAAQKLGLSEVYIRRMIQQGKIQTTKVQVGDSEVWKHEISEATLTAWRNSAGTHTVRQDGRNKFVMYATPEELTALQALATEAKIGAVIEKANKPDDVKKRYAAQKQRRMAKKAEAKAKTPVVA